MTIKRETVEERKALPLASGVLNYFPDALLVVAEVSRVGNEQHHPGEPLHWDKSKSTDEADALMRHLLDRGTYDTDGLRHTAKVAWRALALLQRELDAEDAAELCVCHVPGVPVGEKHQRFVGYGGTGDPATRSASESRAYDGFRPEVEADWLVQAMDFDARYPVVTFENRGQYPPDTRVGGLLWCCGATEHPLSCRNFRA